MNKIKFICFLLCCTAVLHGAQDATGNFAGIKSDSINFRNKIFVKSRFWGTYECNGNKLSFKGVKQKYIDLGDKKLLAHRKNALLLEWLGPLPFYITSFVLISQRVPAYVSFPILLVGFVPGIIGENLYYNTINEYNFMIQENKATMNRFNSPVSLRLSFEF
jgi:hypothetical protein